MSGDDSTVDKEPVFDMVRRWVRGPGQALVDDWKGPGTRAQVAAGQQRPDYEPVQSVEGGGLPQGSLDAQDNKALLGRRYPVEGGGRFSIHRGEVAVYTGGVDIEVDVPDGSGRKMRHGDELDTSTDPWTLTRRPYLAESYEP